jgi:hypothetical protein
MDRLADRSGGVPRHLASLGFPAAIEFRSQDATGNQRGGSYHSGALSFLLGFAVYGTGVGSGFCSRSDGANGALVPVRVENCELDGLLSGIVYVDLVGVEEEEALRRLLAGLRGERPKPAIAPPYPIGAQPAFPRRDEAHDPGAQQPIPQPGHGSATAAVPAPAVVDSVDFEPPPYVIVLRDYTAVASFHVTDKATRMSLAFEQSPFKITTNSPYLKQDSIQEGNRRFEFQFPSPSEYEVIFEIFVKKADDLNLTVIAASGQVLWRAPTKLSASPGGKVCSRLSCGCWSEYGASGYRSCRSWRSSLSARLPLASQG